MTTIVGVLEIDLFIPASASLKQKRMVVKSLKDRIHKKFNAAISEVDFQDKWQRCTLAVAVVAESEHFVQESLNKIFTFMDNDPGFEISRYLFDYR